MSQRLYSVDQVADLLGLHVKTVRSYVRDGRLPAARIGKQYRITHESLEAFTGGTVAAAPGAAARRRHVDVSSIVEIDAIGPKDAHRVTTLLTGAAGGNTDGRRLRFETSYDEERARLKVVVLGGLSETTRVLELVGTVVEP
ncbi:helix-turn-helix domain-containing protein [Streptomonospora arabica]|uniref:Helix-turn-helix domain-containing protein n=1 Tax=Streptomonospora arabica TaxID=412417 RepID=A0ABV9SKK9_9ACTN